MLLKYAREFLRYLHNFRFEQTEDGGIYFPGSRVLASGEYLHGVNGKDWRRDPNIVTYEGLDYILDQAFNGSPGTPDTTWYVSLFGASGYVPALTDSMLPSWPTDAGEITSTAEGYTGTDRQAWTSASAASGVIDSYASKATFDIRTATTLSVYGAGLHSDILRGTTTGVLISATKFGTVRTLNDQDQYQLGYRMTFTST